MKNFFKIILFFVFITINASEKKPLASIITSVYNGDEFISGFLSDITRQTIFDQCELILINANSPGCEEDLIKEYMKKFSNIIYKKLDNDPGLYAVWNMAIKMTNADYITNANLDDRRNPESLEMHVKALNENPDIDLVYSDFYVTFAPNETFECNTHQYSIMPPDFSRGIMYKCITGPQPMWRRDVHQKYGFFDETFKCGGDFEMWNRAVSLGSKFKKVPGFSGMFYFNPKGLSTDSAKKALQDEELFRVNEKYGHIWLMDFQYFCTVTNSKYFPHLLNLIGCIHKLSFESLGQIAVFDLGLTEEQINQLNKIAKVSVYKIETIHPDQIKSFLTHPSGRMVPGFYSWKFVVLKQALKMFPYVIYLDSGTTIKRPLDKLFQYIQQHGYFLCNMGDEKFHNQIAHPIRWGATEYVKKEFNLDMPERSWILEKETLLSGFVGVSRKALDYFVNPLYELSKNINLFKDDGTTPDGFGTGRHDQTVISIFSYLNGLTIHNQDHTQQTPMYLNIDGKNEELYITWNPKFVDEKTFVYNSRYDLKNLEENLKCIKLRMP